MVEPLTSGLTGYTNLHEVPPEVGAPVPVDTWELVYIDQKQEPPQFCPGRKDWSSLRVSLSGFSYHC